jgi:hypothetical protein
LAAYTKFIIICAIGLFVFLGNSCSLATNNIADSGEIYQQRTVHDPDGIGKFYMGREIAQVMGHRGAGWLERPSRETGRHQQN